MAQVVLERLGRLPIGEQRVEIVEALRLACRPDRATDRSTLGGRPTDSRVGGGVRGDRPRGLAGDRPGAGALVGLLR